MRLIDEGLDAQDNRPDAGHGARQAMVQVSWIGHGTFQIESNGHRVLIDPFINGNPTATQKADDFSPDTILVTHAHGDHVDHVGDVVEIAERSGATVYAIVELAAWFADQGLATTVGFFGGTADFPGGSAKLVPAVHTSTTPDGKVTTPPAGMVVRFGGKTIYFAGDTSLFGDMAFIGDEELDIAVLPIGDHFTMGPSDAVKAARLLRAPVIIPGHYNTFPAIAQNAAAFAADVESHTASRVTIFQPGETREL